MVEEVDMAPDQGSRQESDSVLAAGTSAPPFTLKSIPGKSYSLSDFRGKPVVLVFYPADWSPVCGDQIALYNEMLEELAEYQAQVLGVSVDGEWCHKAFAENRSIHFPLLCDFEPKGEVSRRYGAYDRVNGMSQRALFVIDGNGMISWSYLSPIDVNPGADGIFAALDKLGIRTGDRASQQPRPTTIERERKNDGEISAS